MTHSETQAKSPDTKVAGLQNLAAMAVGSHMGLPNPADTKQLLCTAAKLKTRAQVRIHDCIQPVQHTVGGNVTPQTLVPDSV